MTRRKEAWQFFNKAAVFPQTQQERGLRGRIPAEGDKFVDWSSVEFERKPLTFKVTVDNTSAPESCGWRVHGAFTGVKNQPLWGAPLKPHAAPLVMRRTQAREGTPGPQCPDFMRLNDINSTGPRVGVSRFGKNPM